MTESLESLKKQLSSQLEWSLQIGLANTLYGEKAVAANFSMLRGLIEKPSRHDPSSTEGALNIFNAMSGYYDTCFRLSLGYQQCLLPLLLPSRS